MQPLVSIITPMYCGERFVAQTIESVMKQTYKNWEMIIIDDASPDKGRGKAIVSTYIRQDQRIRLIELEKNRGSSGARNVGIEEAKGQYIALLDSDDLWETNFLSEQLDYIKEKKAALVYSSYKMIDENNNEVLRPFHVKSSVKYHDLLKQNDIGCLTALYDISKLGKQYLNEDLGSIRDDFELWLRLIKMTGIAHGNDKLLARYRVMQNSTTGNKLKMIRPQWLIYRKIEKLSFTSSLYYILCWALSGLKKYNYGK